MSTTTEQKTMQAKTDEQRKHISKMLGCELREVCAGGVCATSTFITYEQMLGVVEYLRSFEEVKETESKETKGAKDALFEECWVAYRRKGIKKKAREYWMKLKDEERVMVMPHIKAYVGSREVQYQKDFERYLRDKVFTTVVYSNNLVVYDPTRGNDAELIYSPTCGGALTWNDYYNTYLWVGLFDGFIPDGYTDDNRPQGARVMLNNGRGIIEWSKETKTWNKV